MRSPLLISQGRGNPPFFSAGQRSEIPKRAPFLEHINEGVCVRLSFSFFFSRSIDHGAGYLPSEIALLASLFVPGLWRMTPEVFHRRRTPWVLSLFKGLPTPWLPFPFHYPRRVVNSRRRRNHAVPSDPSKDETGTVFPVNLNVSRHHFARNSFSYCHLHSAPSPPVLLTLRHISLFLLLSPKSNCMATISHQRRFFSPLYAPEPCSRK